MRFRVLSFLLFVSVCSASYGQGKLYKIKDIKVVHNYYVIYATKNDSTVKIASKKEKVNNCNRLKKNESYPLLLSKIQSLAGSEVDCFSFDKKTVICKELDADLYIATNLKGLCLIRK
jgi:hypothetical protein